MTHACSQFRVPVGGRRRPARAAAAAARPRVALARDEVGNEIDGPWQLGIASAEDYGKIASQVAKAMRQMDPNPEFVVCGSSNRLCRPSGRGNAASSSTATTTSTSSPATPITRSATATGGSFLASAVDMDAFIEAVIAAADGVKAALRSERTVDISFDEWNVWHSDRFNESGRSPM